MKVVKRELQTDYVCGILDYVLNEQRLHNIFLFCLTN